MIESGEDAWLVTTGQLLIAYDNLLEVAHQYSMSYSVRTSLALVATHEVRLIRLQYDLVRDARKKHRLHAIHRFGGQLRLAGLRQPQLQLFSALDDDWRSWLKA